MKGPFYFFLSLQVPALQMLNKMAFILALIATISSKGWGPLEAVSG
jgi:hypothetical protein